MLLTKPQKDKIAARLSNLECPVCRGRHLSLNSATSHVLCSEVPGPRIDIEDFKVVDCAVVLCLDCGYIMQFHLGTIAK